MTRLSLLYHRVNELKPDPWTLCVSPKHFAEHLQVMKRLSLLPMVTFDDGYADNLYTALPLLKKFDVPARFYVISGALRLETETWWDALERLFLMEKVDQRAYDDAFAELRPLRYSQRERVLEDLFDARGLSRHARPERRIMSEDEVRRLAASSLAEVGAHTVTHPVLSLLDLEEQEREIVGSKTRLEEVIGKAISGFAYPNGMNADYTSDTVEIVRRAGFAYAYSAFQHRRADGLQLPRVMIRDWDGDQFARVLQEAQNSGD